MYSCGGASQLARDLQVVGIRRGFEGLLSGEFEALDRARIANIVQRGGTLLGTARSERFRTVEGRGDAVRVLRAHRIDGLVLIGGDGTFSRRDRPTAADRILAAILGVEAVDALVGGASGISVGEVSGQLLRTRMVPTMSTVEVSARGSWPLLHCWHDCTSDTE